MNITMRNDDWEKIVKELNALGGKDNTRLADFIDKRTATGASAKETELSIDYPDGNHIQRIATEKGITWTT